MRILNASLDSMSAPSLMKEAMMMMMMRMMTIYNVLPLHLDGGGHEDDDGEDEDDDNDI